jgi:peptidyl-prolyl cis-trans isomerase A (cyclophilin A)
MNTLSFRSRFGEFSIEMCDDRAPVTCQYFRKLARTGALDNASVFRIVAQANHHGSEEHPINIVQIGPMELFSGARHPIKHENTKQTGLSHRKWTVSAARFDLGELYGSFFICLRDEPELDYDGSRQPDGQGFAAFGHVVEGFETIEQIFDCAEPNEMLEKQIPIQEASLSISPSSRGSSCD